VDETATIFLLFSWRFEGKYKKKKKKTQPVIGSTFERGAATVKTIFFSTEQICSVHKIPVALHAVIRQFNPLYITASYISILYFGLRLVPVSWLFPHHHVHSLSHPRID
jgi:hypothetical protein